MILNKVKINNNTNIDNIYNFHVNVTNRPIDFINVGSEGYTMTVSFANSAIRLYDQNNNLLNTISSAYNQTYELANLERLVFNRSTGLVYKQSNDTADSEVILLYNNYGCPEGLLACYYYSEQLNILKNTEQSMLYWTSGHKPTFSVDKSDNSVTITFPNASFYIYRKNGGDAVPNPISILNGKTIKIANKRMLVFNIKERTYGNHISAEDADDTTLDTVDLSEFSTRERYVLFANSYIHSFTGLLASYYYEQKFEDSVGDGGSFDISLYNKSGNTIPSYNTLTNALAAVPAFLQKGGLWVQFLQNVPAIFSVANTVEDTIPSGATLVQSDLNLSDGQTYNASGISVDVPLTVGESLTYYMPITVSGATKYSKWVITRTTNDAKNYVYYRAKDPSVWRTEKQYWETVDNREDLWGYITGGKDNISISRTGDVYSVSFSGYVRLFTYSNEERFKWSLIGQSFTLNNLQSLIFDLNTNKAYVVSYGTLHLNSIVLLTNRYGNLEGILSGYYYDKLIQDTRNQVCTYVWWSSNGDPEITLGATDGSVAVKFPSKVWSVKNKDGVTIEAGNSSGMGETFVVPSYKKLVFNNDTRTIQIINADDKINGIIFLMNVRGMYFSGLLEPFINYADRVNAEYSGYYIYWKSPGNNQYGIPAFSRSAVNSLTIKFPNSNFHIYKKGGGYFVQNCDAGIETYEEGGQTLTRGKTLTLTNNQILVYDKSDNTIKAVGLGTALSSLCVILLTNIMGVNGTGLLAPYYHYNCAQEEISVYYAGLARPTFVVNGTTIQVTVPAGMIIESSTLGVLESGTGIAGTYEVANRQKLVFDQTDRHIKVVSDSEYGVFYNLLTNYCGYVSGLLSTYYSQYSNGIHNLYNTEKEKVILQNFVKRPLHEGSVIESSVVPLVLLHFSDLHENRENLKRLLDYYSMHNSFITDILNTGDTINKFSDGYTWYEDIIKEKLGYTEVEEGGQTVQVPNNILLTTVGNHEMTNGSGEPTPTNKGVYDMQFKSAIDHGKWGDIVQPDNAEANGLCYYYKDYVSSRVRLVVLDNFASNMTAQVTWLRGVLADANDLTVNRTPDGEEATYFKYCVVCCAHFPTKINLMKNVTFCSMDGDGQFVFYMQDALVNEVDTFINNQGNFACWLTGHVHGNYFGFVTDHTNQICIAVASASYNRNSGSEARENYTKSQDCFNIVSINDDTKCITMHRVGSDYDKYLRHVGEMCFNYETKQLIYND